MKKIAALLSILFLMLSTAALADSTISGLPSQGLVTPQDEVPVYNPYYPGQNFAVDFGTAAAANVGTSGANVPLLNGANTYSGVQTFLSGDLTAADPLFTGGSIQLPSGTTSARPATPVNGMIRYNITTSGVEAYVNGAWGPIGGSTSSAGSTGNIQVAGASGAFAAYSGITCASHKWLNAFDVSGTAASSDCAQPSFSDLMGTASNAQIPAPTTSALGGVIALASATTHQFLTYIDSSGAQHAAQPAASDISGLAASATTDTTNAANISGGTLPAARLPAPTTSTLGGLLALASSTAHQVVQYIDASGVQHLAQLAFSDLSGTLNNSQLPTSGATAGAYTNASVTINAQGIVTSASSGAGAGYNITLGPGLTTTVGTSNASPVSSSNNAIYPQTVTDIQPSTYTIGTNATDANGLVSFFGASAPATWTLATAGSAGFGIGSVFSFSNPTAYLLTINTSGSSFLGVPLSGASLALGQNGWASCTPDANHNWDCIGSVNSTTGATSNFGTTATTTNPSIASDVTTGLYTSGAGKIDASVAGTQTLDLSSSGLNLVPTSAAYLLAGANAISYSTHDSTYGGSLAVGSGAVSTGTSSAAYQNTVVGYKAQAGGALTTAAIANSVYGYEALYNVTSGNHDLAFGDVAMYSTTSGAHNIALQGMYANTTGSYNIGIGEGALNDSNGSSNVAIGFATLYNGGTCCTTNATNYNTAVGYEAGYQVSSGTNNTIIGYEVASRNLTSGTNNVLIGTSNATDVWFGYSIGTVGINSGPVGQGDTAVGYLSIDGYSTAGATTNNSAFGYYALHADTSGVDNTALGYAALQTVTTGTNNLAVGYNVASGTLTTGSNNVLIGTSSSVTTASAGTNNELNVQNSITGTMSGGTNPSICTVGQVCRLAHLTGANLNVTTDQALTIGPMTSGNQNYLSSATKYVITEIDVGNCSASTTAAQGAFYTAASKGGTAIGSTTTAYTNCQSSTTRQRLINVANMDSTILTAATLYLSLTTAQGATDTGDVDVYGIPYN